MNSILCGLEGRDWVDTGLGSSEDDKVVTFPDGLDAFSVPYYAYFTCGIMGNEYIDWLYVGADGTVSDRRAEHKEFMENAVISPIYGFTMDTANVKTAVASISNVESQYLGGLLTGELDPDVYIPEFISALENAGINDVITEAQSQLDAWEASK
jgi:putative aldouronate transport system substrate-binding protein